MWYKGLTAIIGEIKNVKENMDMDKRFYREKWFRAENGKGRVTKGDLVQVVESMNINMPSQVIIAMFKLVDKDKSGFLDQSEFYTFLDLLQKRYVIIIVCAPAQL
jgi:Ca2+-binding EF-hand superfamily protein